MRKGRIIIITLTVLITIIFQINGEAGVLYLNDGKVISKAKNIKIEDTQIYYEIDGKAHRIDMKQVKEIEFISDTPRKEPVVSNTPKHQTRKTTIQKPKKRYIEPNPVARVQRSKAKADIKAELAKTYAGHYSTQKLLLDSHMESYDYLTSLPSNSVNNQILLNLIRVYYPHFSTIKLLYESNIKAYRQLQE